MVFRKNTYDVNTILNYIKTPGQRTNLDGDSVRVKGVRLVTFLVKGITCVTCGLTGKFFAKEKARPEESSFHLNLYAIDNNGKEVLMTRDHIIPKSKGGSEEIENMQTMCCKCNCKKSDKLL